jgi:hypothetical protein
LTDAAPVLRCANRLGKPPALYDGNVGFRCVRAIREAPAPAATDEEDAPL